VEFPREFDAVLALPGVGRYTAGAICSIAFNQPTPILDGNVMRVLTRVFGISENPKEKETNARLWQLAEKLVRGAAACKVESRGWKEGGTGGTFNTQHSTPNVEVSCSYLNQSLMELGALVCTPRNPQCGGCPVKTLCVAFREGRVEELPNLDKRAAATARRFTAFVVERDGKFLVRQRPAGVVNGHLWEFPNVELTGARPVETPSGAVKRKLLRVTDPRSGAKTPDGAQGTDAPYQPNDFRIIDRKPLCTVKHSITRYRITLEAYRAEIAAGRLADDGGKGVTSVESRRGAAKRKLLRVTDPRSGGVWLALAQLDRLAFTSAHRKILERLLKV
jgi:A/G-specific adenine glycosylase